MANEWKVEGAAGFQMTETGRTSADLHIWWRLRVARHPSSCSARVHDATIVATSPSRRPTTLYGMSLPLALEETFCHCCGPHLLLLCPTPILMNPTLVTAIAHISLLL